MTRARLLRQESVLAALGGVLLLLLVAPVLFLFTATTPAEFAQGLAHPLVLPALKLSLVTSVTTLAVAVILGTPLAWLLARARGRLARAVETASQLPIVLPPAVAGVALLLTFGSQSPLAGLLYPEGTSLAPSLAAVVLSQLFVSAPLYLRSATTAFRTLDPRMELVARTFGASPWRVFLRVSIPLAASGMTTGAALCWARALGEFGATLMFAGNLPGVTQTLPLAIYTALAADLRAAQALSVLLVLVAFGLLVAVRVSSRIRDAG
ncbi:MAG: ABC transporter permease [Polyangiaceae bacterium]